MARIYYYLEDAGIDWRSNCSRVFSRYMSKKELQKILAGDILITNERQLNCSKKNKTSSRGFCFLGEKTILGFFDDFRDGDMEDAFCEAVMEGNLGNPAGKYCPINTDAYTIVQEFGDTYSALECFDMMHGIVDANDLVLVEFECKGISRLHVGYGTYLNPKDDELVSIDEYSLEEYSRDVMKPLRYFEYNPKEYSWGKAISV